MPQVNNRQTTKTTEDLIQSLVHNIERLKHAYTRLKEENEELFRKKEELLQEINQKDQYISDLKHQIENLKVTNALIFSEDIKDTETLQEIKHSAKIKLNQIIREIDTAIKLLSTNELQKS